MTSTLPPVRGAAFSFPVALVSQADTDVFKETVTLAAGDIQVSKDGGAFANLATFPPSELALASTAASGVLWVALTATEMTADVVTVLFRDAAGAEWQSAMVTIYTAGQTFDTTDGVVDGLSAVKPDNKPTVAATGEASSNLTQWLGVAPLALSSQRVQSTQGNNPVTAYVYGFGYLPTQYAAFDDGDIIGVTGKEVTTLSLAYPEQAAGQVMYVATGTYKGWSSGIVSVSGNVLTIKDTPPGSIDGAGIVIAPFVAPGGVITSDAGAGAITHTITVNDGANPIEGVSVWISTDSAGSNVIAGSITTSSLGQAVFYLDAGTYYAWMQKSGYNFTNPTSITVA